MPDPLLELEKRRSKLLAEISALGRFSSVARSPPPAAVVASRIATVISRTTLAMAPTCG